MPSPERASIFASGENIPSRVKVEPELVQICKDIEAKGWTLEQWAEHDSYDMFQTETFCGGFDCCDMLFTFGRYQNGEELYCVQLTLDQVPLVTKGIMRSIEIQRFD